MADSTPLAAVDLDAHCRTIADLRAYRDHVQHGVTALEDEVGVVACVRVCVCVCVCVRVCVFALCTSICMHVRVRVPGNAFVGVV